MALMEKKKTDDAPSYLSKQIMCIPYVSVSLIKCNDYM